MLRRRLICKNSACPAYEPVATMTADEQLHCECGAILELEIFPIQVVFTGPITARYLDKSAEGADKPDGSHWAWERPIGEDGRPGKPQAVRIESWQDQKEYCKRNHLATPSSLPNHLEMAEDGKTVKNTVGMPGCEV